MMLPEPKERSTQEKNVMMETKSMETDALHCAKSKLDTHAQEVLQFEQVFEEMAQE
jgi:hypothetical protein